MIKKLKAYFLLKKLTQEAKEEVIMENQVKPGWKTTEFWGKNLVQIVSLGAMIAAFTGHNITPEQQATIVQTGTIVFGAVEAVYGLVRGWTKNK
jgi:hypothetical protein